MLQHSLHAINVVGTIALSILIVGIRAPEPAIFTLF